MFFCLVLNCSKPVENMVVDKNSCLRIKMCSEGKIKIQKQLMIPWSHLLDDLHKLISE